MQRLLNAMRVFADTLRTRVGLPLSVAPVSRNMGVSPKTRAKYLDILEALQVVPELGAEQDIGQVQVRDAARWLNALAV